MIPLNSISELLEVFTTSDLFTLKVLSYPSSPIFSKNSGMIERCAEVMVYLVNKIRTFLVIVKSVRKTVTAKDFPEPLPPVIIKYLASDLNRSVYLSLRFRVYKVY